MDTTLAQYLERLPGAAARDTFAAACGTSLQYLRHIAAGRKTPKVELCIAIERASGGSVRCEGLRPDIDWLYLSRRVV